MKRKNKIPSWDTDGQMYIQRQRPTLNGIGIGAQSEELNFMSACQPGGWEDFLEKWDDLTQSQGLQEMLFLLVLDHKLEISIRKGSVVSNGK